jgi:hypothetical protein
MDNFLSSLQLNSNSSNSQSPDNLMQKQQETTAKLNALLEQSASALSCGPTCQSLKVGDELKQKYLDAQTNLQTAPIRLEQTKKNYYVFTEGKPYYDNMLEEQLKEKSEKIGDLIAENFNEEVTNAETMNGLYNTDIVNSKNTKELYQEYLIKNKEMEVTIRDSHGDVLTNDRKTYYETSALDGLLNWYNILWYIFYVLAAVYVIGIFFVSNQTSMIVKIVSCVLLVFFPYYINYLVKGVYNFFKSIYAQFPKSVYNSL